MKSRDAGERNAAAALAETAAGGPAPSQPAVDWWKTAGRLDAQRGRAAVQAGLVRGRSGGDRLIRKGRGFFMGKDEA